MTFFKQLEQKSPQIFTVLGVIGVAATAVLASKATIIAAKKIYHAENAVRASMLGDSDKPKPTLTTKEKILLVWKDYIPTVAVGIGTVACVVGSNMVQARRISALLDMYTLSETAKKAYINKVRETVGPETDQTVKKEVAKDKMRQHKPPTDTPRAIELYDGGGNVDVVLCYDAPSDRYFHSTRESIKEKINDLNRMQLTNGNLVSLNDWYDMLGLQHVSWGDYIGWSQQDNNFLAVDFSSYLDDHGRPCLVIDYEIPLIIQNF